MKSVVRFRLVGLVLLLSGTLLTACHKTSVDPVAPADSATQAAGTYTYSALSFNGKTLPASQTNLKGTVRIVRLTATMVSMDLNIRQKADESEFIVGSLSDVVVADAGGGTFTLTHQGDQLGAVTSNKLTINGKDDDNVSFSLTATK